MVLMVDNLAASGDYYQIPTLSINTIFDPETQQEIDMPYGTYTLQLMVSTLMQTELALSAVRRSPNPLPLRWSPM